MMDIHAHSFHSDGSDSPEEIVKKACEMGLKLCAVSDHDCIDGVHEAIEAGKKYSIKVISGLEMDVQCDMESATQAHILGYGFDPAFPELHEIFDKLASARDIRNEKILERLDEMGVHIRIQRDERGVLVSRTHIADGLVKAGHVASINEAFTRYLGRHGSARVDMERIDASEYIEIIHIAGGLTVLAHPGLLEGDMYATIQYLAERGLDGVEVYYPAHRARQMVALRAQAKELGLFISTGSDYHGEYRKHVPFGFMAELASFDQMICETEEKLSNYA